jgi:hypothetical protein
LIFPHYRVNYFDLAAPLFGRAQYGIVYTPRRVLGKAVALHFRPANSNSAMPVFITRMVDERSAGAAAAMRADSALPSFWIFATALLMLGFLRSARQWQELRQWEMWGGTELVPRGRMGN